MGEIISGKPVAEKITEELKLEVESLIKRGIKPKLCIMRVGQKPEDIAYEESALARCKSIGIEVEVKTFDENVNHDDFIIELESADNDRSVHGILVFRPLPKQIDESIIKYSLSPEKDIDCMNPVNAAKVIEGDKTGFPPCTATSIIEILRHYNVDIAGKKAVVLGRSTVVGKPAAFLMINENATVTVCHSKTENLKEITRQADILIVAIGKRNMINDDYIKPGAVIIDVGINMDEDGNLCGDVDFELCKDKALMITPVPGGVGSVTTSVLAKHVVKACQYLTQY